MEGDLEALFAQRGDCASDLFCPHRGSAAHCLGGDRECVRLAWHWPVGCGCSEGEGLPGGTGDRHCLFVGIPHGESVSGRSLRVYRPTYTILITLGIDKERVLWHWRYHNKSPGTWPLSGCCVACFRSDGSRGWR